MICKSWNMWKKVFWNDDHFNLKLLHFRCKLLEWCTKILERFCECSIVRLKFMVVGVIASLVLFQKKLLYQTNTTKEHYHIYKVVLSAEPILPIVRLFIIFFKKRIQ